MAVRISGTTIPNDKRVKIALSYVYGIGPKISQDILQEAKIDGSIRVKDLKDSEIRAIQEVINKKYITEGDLRREKASNIKRLKEIACRRGDRHSKKLPVRGQRTKTNSRTVRGGKRTTVGSGKSKAASQKT
jgi:small subunit ribosomal protein S13